MATLQQLIAAAHGLGPWCSLPSRKTQIPRRQQNAPPSGSPDPLRTVRSPRARAAGAFLLVAAGSTPLPQNGAGRPHRGCGAGSRPGSPPHRNSRSASAGRPPPGSRSGRGRPWFPSVCQTGRRPRQQIGSNCAARPTRTPARFFSVAPMYFDTTNDRSTRCTSRPVRRPSSAALRVLPTLHGPQPGLSWRAARGGNHWQRGSQNQLPLQRH